ncbi:60S acidic ribosomal protein P0 [Myotis davidii]|uniref:Large ribosomal subunit protein uL10 n=1 Tax=Myotis davidii TaxID=225400 RepID=L5LZ78_MYODS|nr:60S acidic ribosomal protein P0 [Myotis davidii]
MLTVRSDWGQHHHLCCPNRLSGAGGGGEALRGNWDQCHAQAAVQAAAPTQRASVSGAIASSRYERQLPAPIAPQEQAEVEKPSAVIGTSSRHSHLLMALSIWGWHWALAVGARGGSGTSSRYEDQGRTVVHRSKEFSEPLEIHPDDNNQHPALVWRPCSPTPPYRYGKNPPCSMLCHLLPMPTMFLCAPWCQCGLQAEAADPQVPPREGWGADGQQHHDAQGHPGAPGKQPSSGETAASDRGNVGFVFTKEDLPEIRDLLLANRMPAAARAGAMAPCEVTVPAQNTVLGPEKTSFFQALGITAEILSDAQLIKPGDKVGASEATPLHMLNISPFSPGLVTQQVSDNGGIYNPEVLDITEETLHSRCLEGVRNVASVCLQIGDPTVALVPHSIINGYEPVLALSVETDYTFPLAEKGLGWRVHAGRMIQGLREK